MAESSVFETPRLILRAMRRSDLPALYVLMSDPDVMRYFDVCRPMSRQEVEIQLDVWLHHQEAHGFAPGLIVWKATGEAIGHGGLAYYPETQETGPELIYLFRKGVWGKGLGTEFALAAGRYGLEVVSADCVLATVRPENGPSIRVLEKAGFTFHKTLPEVNRFLYWRPRST